MIDDLKARLALEGIDTANLCPLRDVAVEGDDDLARLEQSDLEERYPIYTLAVSPTDALALWERLRTISDRTDYYPVILGDKSDVGKHWESREFAAFPDEYLLEAQSIDGKMWLEKTWQETLVQDSRFANGNYRGEWNANARPFTTFNLEGNLRETTATQYIGLLETTMSWQAPAYLAFGCYNDCPCSAQHVSVHRYWQTMYQTEIIMLTADTLVNRVSAPVANQDDALQLAREQIAYCGDNYNLSKSLDSYAAQLMHSTYWGFWWD